MAKEKTQWLRRIPVFIGVIAVLLYLPCQAYAATKLIQQKEPEPHKLGKFALNVQGSVFTGDYGALNGKTTTVTYLTETLKYIGQRGELSLSFPYTFRNGGAVTAGEAVSTGTAAIPKRADGIGDIQLKGKYYWLEETDSRPIVDLTGRVKFPAADDKKGLGTGKYDFGMGPSFLKRCGKYIWLADTELVLRQRPSGSSIKRVRFDYALGAGYPFTGQFTAYLFAEGSSKTARESDSPFELVLAGTYRHNSDYSINGYVLKGLTNGSPDIGGSLGVTRYF